jgi:excinuclease ABC subunit C
MKEKKKELELSKELMNLINKFQDTVHDTAIEYHRKLRDTEVSKSKLDNIKGIGDKKKKELLKKFSTIAKIKDANLEELTQIKGITRELAEKLKNEL